MTEQKDNGARMATDSDILYAPLGKTAYSKKALVEEFNRFSILNQSLEVLVKDSANPEAQENAGEIIHKNKDFYTTLNRPTVLRKEGQATLESMLGGIKTYMGFENNRQTALKDLSKEDYSGLLLRVSLPDEVKKDEKYKDVAKAIGELQKVGKAENEGIESKRKYLQEKIKNNKKLSKSLQEMYLSGIATDDYVELLFKQYTGVANHNVSFLFSEENKEAVNSEEMFKAALSYVPDKKKGDYDIAIAQTIYQKETQKKK